MVSTIVVLVPLAQVEDVLLQVGAVLRVQAGGRLVEEEQLGRVDQAHRDVEAAALAAGEGRHRPVGDLAQAQRVDQLVGPAAGASATCSPYARPWLISSSRPALAVPGAVALADVADPLPHLALLPDHVEAGHPRGARRSAGSAW